MILSLRNLENVQILDSNIFIIKSYFKDIYINIFIIKENEDILLIDTGLLSSFTKIKECLEYLGYKYIFIINTHSHWDHIGSNFNIKRAFNCIIIGHLKGENNFKNLSRQWEKVFNKEDSFVKPTEEDKALFLKETNYGICPDILLNNNEIINIGESKYKIIYTPGHSDCSVCIYNLKNKYLYSGDFLSGEGVGNGIVIIDYDFDKYLESIDLIKEIDINKILPSHSDIKSDVEVLKFINGSKNELLSYKRIIIDLIKKYRAITIIKLIVEFSKETGKVRSPYWNANSINKVLLSLLNEKIIRKKNGFYSLNEENN